MKRGLVLGKFMPIHQGHIDLINFGLNFCDELTVLICATATEPIDASIRLNWVTAIFKNQDEAKPQLLIYNETDLPNTSVSSKEVSLLWATFLKENIEPVDIIFSSEKYGEYLAEYLNCENVFYDLDRVKSQVSASQIRHHPFKYWDFIPAQVRPYYVKKICIYGTESTGKTTMSKKLADFFNTTLVPEMAREILEKTVECTVTDLQQIALLHAKTINEKTSGANKILIVDTDLNITRSYSKFLFHKELIVPTWVEEANKFDLYLYLDNDAPFVQDGTRLVIEERNLLDLSHRKQLTENNIEFILLKGNWEQKYLNAVKIISEILADN